MRYSKPKTTKRILGDLDKCSNAEELSVYVFRVKLVIDNKLLHK